jgi:putative transposase
MVVQSLTSDHGMSEGRACKANALARSTLRYRPVPRDECGVNNFTQNHLAINPRHGFDLLATLCIHLQSGGQI